MIGKIKKFNFQSLFILNTFALIVTSYLFNNFIFTGFLDDYLSIKKKENTGLKTKEKLILQSVISIIFILLAYETVSYTHLTLPTIALV